VLLWKLRTFYQPDPNHGLAGIMSSTVGCDKRVYAAAVGVVYCSKYIRAPFGSFKNWKAMLRGILWFLMHYSLSDAILDDEFTDDIGKDIGQSGAYLRENLEEYRRLLTEFTTSSCGPRVTLVRWFTWTRLYPLPHYPHLTNYQQIKPLTT
jgi:hypothetical protein